MKWFEWFKKKEEKEEKKEEVISVKKLKKKHTLKLHLETGSVSYAVENDDLETLFITFKPFLKWYFGRPESVEYLFKHKGGFTLHKRKNIKGFDLIKVEV